MCSYNRNENDPKANWCINMEINLIINSFQTCVLILSLLLAVQLYINHLGSLCLIYSICKMVVINLHHRVIGEM